MSQFVNNMDCNETSKHAGGRHALRDLTNQADLNIDRVETSTMLARRTDDYITGVGNYCREKSECPYI